MSLRPLARRAPQRGLSMIEVLAALVIFSSGASILFVWIGQTAQRLARLDAEQAVLIGELGALQYARSINPMRDPSGRVQLADAEVEWASKPSGEESDVRGPSGALGNYAVRLYEVTLTIRPAGREAVTRALYLAGWRQTREVKREPFFLQSPS